MIEKKLKLLKKGLNCGTRVLPSVEENNKGPKTLGQISSSLLKTKYIALRKRRDFFLINLIEYQRALIERFC